MIFAPDDSRIPQASMYWRFSSSTCSKCQKVYVIESWNLFIL